MWSAAVLTVVPEGLAVRTVVVVSLVVGALVSVVELATADVTVGDQGVAVTASLSEGDRDRSPVGGRGMDRRRPAVVTSDLSVAEAGTSLRVDHDNSSWSRAENRNSLRSKASQSQWLWMKRRPLRMQRLMYNISIIEVCVKWFYKDCYESY